MEDPLEHFEFDGDCWRDLFFSDLMLDEEVQCEIKFRKHPKIPKKQRRVLERFLEDETTRPDEVKRLLLDAYHQRRIAILQEILSPHQSAFENEALLPAVERYEDLGGFLLPSGIVVPRARQGGARVRLEFLCKGTASGMVRFTLDYSAGMNDNDETPTLPPPLPEVVAEGCVYGVALTQGIPFDIIGGSSEGETQQ